MIGFRDTYYGRASSLIDIRHATKEDVPWILGQLKHFSKLYGTERSLFGCEDYAKTALTSIIENHLMLISDHSITGPNGFIGGVLTKHLFNPDIIHLAEIFWWVDEMFRGTRAGLLLLNAFTKWGKDNADWVTIAIEAHSPINDKCLLRRGFKLQESSYLLEVGG